MKAGATMPSWGTNKGRPNPSLLRAPTTASGVIRIPGETEPLNVEITMDARSVAMRSGDLELGSWHPDEVTISRRDPWTFVFLAEGDRLVFVPDDAKAFAAHPLTRGLKVTDSSSKPRKLRIPKVPKVRIVPKGRSTVSSDEPERRVQPLRKPALEIRQIRTITPRGSQPESKSKTSDKTATAWIRTIDTAREYGLFGLDRVPVTAAQRGLEHQHTYNHGAAARSGLGKHLCTVCGKIRIRS